MPQKDHRGKMVDPKAGLSSAHLARSSASFEALVSKFSLVQDPFGAAQPPERWEKLWKPLDLSSLPANERHFCLAVDGSIPPAGQSIMIPGAGHWQHPRFSFFPVSARAMPWPSQLEADLSREGKWSPYALPAFLGCAAGFVGAIPGINVGHGAEMEPSRSFLKSCQAILEKPWQEWSFEKIDLAATVSCPAETVEILFRDHAEEGMGQTQPGVMKCPRCQRSLEMGTEAAREISKIKSAGEFQRMPLCRECGPIPLMEALCPGAPEGPKERAFQMMEVMEALFVVELARAIMKASNDFLNVARSLGSLPMFLVKDGPLVVSPTNRLAEPLQTWGKMLAETTFGRLRLVGLEKNSTLLSEMASAYRAETLKVGQICHLGGAQPKAWGEGRGTSRWAEKYALVLPQGVCIFSTPLDSNEDSQKEALRSIAGFIRSNSRPSLDGRVNFPMLAALQKITAMPGKESAMARFAYEKIMSAREQAVVEPPANQSHPAERQASPRR